MHTFCTVAVFQRNEVCIKHNDFWWKILVPLEDFTPIRLINSKIKYKFWLTFWHSENTLTKSANIDFCKNRPNSRFFFFRNHYVSRENNLVPSESWDSGLCIHLKNWSIFSYVILQKAIDDFSMDVQKHICRSVSCNGDSSHTECSLQCIQNYVAVEEEKHRYFADLNFIKSVPFFTSLGFCSSSSRG